jgi:hypothetical protein
VTLVFFGCVVVKNASPSGVAPAALALKKRPSIYAKVTGFGTAANFEYQRHKAFIVHFPLAV